jgi:hypothetical protein
MGDLFDYNIIQLSENSSFNNKTSKGFSNKHAFHFDYYTDEK